MAPRAGSGCIFSIHVRYNFMRMGSFKSRESSFFPLFHIVALSVCCFAASCDRSGTSAEGSKKLEELRLGYFANISHAQAMLGVHTHEFEKAIAPVRLTHRVFNAGPLLIEALFAGELDIGYVGPGPVINAFVKSRGEGIRVIAAGASNGVVIVARPGSGIQKLSDLKGRRLATPQLGNTQDISARHYLLRELGQADVDNVIPIPNAEQSGLMVRGEIDAAWVPEPWGARLVKEAGAKIIAEEKDLWPEKEFSLAVIVTTPEFLKQHPQAVRQFLAAHIEMTRRLNAEPEACAAMFIEAMKAESGKSMSVELLKAAMSRTKYTNWPLEGTFRNYATWLRDVGFSRQNVDVKNLFETGILNSLVKE
ncbi:MAG: ABC transporter substrate-binding protein [Planctomycetes bacterium]|nr:ABC transporter substrate-binding protein [Planctomycetota bacterium]